MADWVEKMVEGAIRLIASGIRTSKTRQQFEPIDADELIARLKENGGFGEMMRHVANTPEFTMRSMWAASPTAIQTLKDMRAEKNA